MKLNYAAIYVFLAAISLPTVYAITSSVILAVLMVLLFPAIITMGVFYLVEGHEYNRVELAGAEQEEYEADVGYDYYVSLVN